MKIQSHIRELAEARGIATSYQLWKEIGGSQESAAQLWSGEFKMIGTNTLAKLCQAFNCQPGNLLSFSPGTGSASTNATKSKIKIARKIK